MAYAQCNVCSTCWGAQGKCLGREGLGRMVRSGGSKGGPQAGIPGAKVGVSKSWNVWRVRADEVRQAGEDGSPMALYATLSLNLIKGFLKIKSLKEKLLPWHHGEWSGGGGETASRHEARVLGQGFETLPRHRYHRP